MIFKIWLIQVFAEVNLLNVYACNFLRDDCLGVWDIALCRDPRKIKYFRAMQFLIQQKRFANCSLFIILWIPHYDIPGFNFNFFISLQYSCTTCSFCFGCLKRKYNVKQEIEWTWILFKHFDVLNSPCSPKLVSYINVYR